MDAKNQQLSANINFKQDMKLQADPTIVFANQNFEVQRVLSIDKEIDSPYNTYFYGGLPPGPIAMPDITAIEAVLNPEKHNYIYFCASVTRFGYHEFAVSVSDHEVNRKNYIKYGSRRRCFRWQKT